jgi:hypothetical protein
MTDRSWRRAADAVKATVMWWEPGRLGIAYDFANGDGEARPIDPEDWPVIRKLDRKGALDYVDDAARKLAKRTEQERR